MFANDNLVIIVAIVVGVIFMFLVICVIIIIVCKRKRADDKCEFLLGTLKLHYFHSSPAKIRNSLIANC